MPQQRPNNSMAKLPKGAYRLPNGNYVLRRGSITAVHKDPPDIDKLARALILLAEQLDADAKNVDT